MFKKAISVCSDLLTLSTNLTIRQVAQVSGNLVASFLAVKYLRLFYRSIEACKSTGISLGDGYDSFCPLAVSMVNLFDLPRSLTLLNVTQVPLDGEHTVMGGFRVASGALRNRKTILITQSY